MLLWEQILYKKAIQANKDRTIIFWCAKTREGKSRKSPAPER